MDKNFTPGGSQYFCDIAMRYFPQLSKHKASDKLSRWIRICTPLLEALEASGWRPRQRLLTPKQLTCIIEQFGEP